MADLSTITPGSRILASDGALIGIVDAVEGGARIRMRPDAGADATGPDLIPSSWVAGIETGLVRLNRDGAEAHRTMNDEIPAGDATS